MKRYDIYTQEGTPVLIESANGEVVKYSDIPKNKITVSKNNEGTAYPFWAIIDPRQNFNTNEDGIHAIAGMITGIFFSRETAERHLKSRRYDFSENAKVYCFSGYWSLEYQEALNEGNGE